MTRFTMVVRVALMFVATIIMIDSSQGMHLNTSTVAVQDETSPPSAEENSFTTANASLPSAEENSFTTANASLPSAEENSFTTANASLPSAEENSFTTANASLPSAEENSFTTANASLPSAEENSFTTANASLPSAEENLFTTTPNASVPSTTASLPSTNIPILTTTPEATETDMEYVEPEDEIIDQEEPGTTESFDIDNDMTTVSQDLCTGNWTQLTDTSCVQLFEDKITWAAARAQCQQLDTNNNNQADLLRIDDQIKFDAIKTAFEGFGRKKAWIGLRDGRWLDDETDAVYTRIFRPHDEYNFVPCAAVDGAKRYLWRLKECSSTYRFICEWTPAVYLTTTSVITTTSSSNNNPTDHYEYDLPRKEDGSIDYEEVLSNDTITLGPGETWK